VAVACGSVVRAAEKVAAKAAMMVAAKVARVG